MVLTKGADFDNNEGGCDSKEGGCDDGTLMPKRKGEGTSREEVVTKRKGAVL